MSVIMADLLPPFPLPRSSSRDNKVSCETLSHVDWFSSPKFERRHHFLYDAEETYWDATDPDLDYAFDDANKVRRPFPPAAATAAHMFGCFPSKTLPPRTMMMSPGREDKRGSADTAGRPRTHPSLIPHSGGIPHSGTIPHSGPIKLNTGPIIGHSGTLKGPAKGPSIIPADVVGKKKPPGYDEEEPRSPEVTCLGHVRLKHNSRKDSPGGGDKKQWKCNLFKKKAPRDFTDKGAKQPTWKQAWTERDKFKKAQHQVDLAEKVALSNSAETEQNRGERSAMFSDYLAQVIADKRPAGTAEEAEYEPQVPPPNSLLLMRGSRNLERESQKPEVLGAQELPSITQKVLMRGSRNLERESQKPEVLGAQELPSITQKGSVNRQISLPKPPPEASIWQRRNISQPTALDTRIPFKLQIKQPCTK